jgi:L-asparaginase
MTVTNPIAPVTKVLVIYTGGTIGMVPRDPNNPASPLTPAPQERLVQYIPNPLDGGIAWDIRGLIDDNGDPVGPLDSSNVGPKHWCYMAKAIADNYDAYDGFVILHGTDTMAYTGSALSFILQNLAKPVIITGSQLPIFKHRTDAVLNFINALSIAGYKASGLPRLCEVAICFADVLLRGCRATKVSTAAWQGFDTPNYPHLGAIGEYIVIDRAVLQPPPAENAPFYADTAMNENVATIPLYPGMGGDVLGRFLSLGDIDGYVLRCFGTGNAPEDEDFLNAIAESTKSGKIIVNTTQCLEGTVEMGLYEASFGLMQAGVITGLDLTPEASLTKLMWLLGTEPDKEEVQIQMQVNQRGEQSGSAFDVRYGKIGMKTKPVELHTISKRPAGQFQVATLKRAILRLTGVGLTDTKDGEDISLNVFINLPSGKADTPTTVPQFAGTLKGTYEGPDKTVLLRDVTATVSRVQETGRPINITLVPPAGKKFWAEGAYLLLFNE